MANNVGLTRRISGPVSAAAVLVAAVAVALAAATWALGGVQDGGDATHKQPGAILDPSGKRVEDTPTPTVEVAGRGSAGAAQADIMRAASDGGAKSALERFFGGLAGGDTADVLATMRWEARPCGPASRDGVTPECAPGVPIGTPARTISTGDPAFQYNVAEADASHALTFALSGNRGRLVLAGRTDAGWMVAYELADPRTIPDARGVSDDARWLRFELEPTSPLPVVAFATSGTNPLSIFRLVDPTARPAGLLRCLVGADRGGV